MVSAEAIFCALANALCPNCRHDEKSGAFCGDVEMDRGEIRLMGYHTVWINLYPLPRRRESRANELQPISDSGVFAANNR